MTDTSYSIHIFLGQTLADDLSLCDLDPVTPNDAAMGTVFHRHILFYLRNCYFLLDLPKLYLLDWKFVT